MKTSFVKRILVGALAVTMTIGLSLSALASGGNGSGGNGSGGNGSGGNGSGGNGSGSNTSIWWGNSSAAEATAATAQAVEAVMAKYNVAGGVSTIPGIYMANSVKGIAMATTKDEFVSMYGLTGGKTPFMRTYNFDKKKSFMCQSVFEATALSQNAIVGPAFNMEIGYNENGKYYNLPIAEPRVIVKAALKDDFYTAGAEYAVICVRAGGAVEVIPATVANGGVIAFATMPGAGSYAVIKY